MIDERAVVTAKFWGALRSRRALSRLREEEFDQLALMVLGLAYVAQSPDYFPSEFIDRAQDLFDMLRKSEVLVDEDRFRSAWRVTWDVLRFTRYIDYPDLARNNGSFDAFESIVGLIDEFDFNGGSRSDFILNCFDDVFHRVVSRFAGVGYRIGDTAAALAANLSAPFSRASEYFTTTGEFAVLRRTLLDTRTTTRIAVIGQLDFFVNFRLALRGIDVNDRPSRDVDPAFFFDGAFVLIDHPRRVPAGGRHQRSSNWMDQQSSLEALDGLLAFSRFETCLIIVPGVDRSARGWRGAMREHLVQANRLLAVIDLPKERIDGSLKQVSAWLIANRRSPVGHVLMVDASGLVGKGELREPGLLMAFVAAIVSQGIPEGWLSSIEAHFYGPGGGNVEAMLDNYFKDGYRDIDGVCRRVLVGELAENDYILVASSYLGSSRSDKKRRTIIPLLNSEPVLEALRHQNDDSRRVYIIGNNGEGKSILLADLAEQLAQEGRRVVGISFGLTDRFPFERPKRDDQPFIYVGARTSLRGITLDRTSADVSRMLREIHVNPERLDVFSAVVKLLGFGERRYLVPAELNNSLDQDRARYAELQQLTDNAEQNAVILQQMGSSQYVLGLMRRERDSSITTFGELSSGEQQLLTLALKLTAYAGNRTVILVDEPELSLHVSWQRAIPAMLEIVGSRLGCSIVVATHSPVVIASATHPTDQCFVARRHALTELSSRQRRSVETALFDGFQTYTANNRQVHERCAAIVSQTIQRLNGDSSMQDDDLPTLESLREELSLMERIIRLADSSPLSHVQEDLELVAHTRAALDELAGIQRRYS
ncbi:AAA family ATPase [Rhizobium sp. 1399]|uniref:AAA family ATPase n=1 Tax=Rhizobium sp. 1399 TaxID=2817758 RepID=UPI00285B8085|nr:AAA family ATPase [Rhizobium sp. 1399]MDR6667084.1 ABC-type Mn2+/Zn2+ transport system ATPase subunit [Rhizobium sp. 1399]